MGVTLYLPGECYIPGDALPLPTLSDFFSTSIAIVAWCKDDRMAGVKDVQTPCGNSGNSRVGRSWLGLGLT